VQALALALGPGITGAARAVGAGTATQAADPTTLSLIDLVSGVGRGRLHPVAIAEAYLDRIERHADLGAFITVTKDLARRQAARVVPGGGAGQPLAGAPIAHKDLFDTAGTRTTGGSRLFDARVPTRDATLVARLTAAGAVTIGKTNTHELGGGVTTINPFFGTTRNPVDRARIAGGSSGGSAAAVAARLVVAATGTDTGGSVRIPAALCGCVGFKPTHGVLSTAGVLGASPTFDHAGFLTRAVADLVPLLRATMGLDPADPSTVPALPMTVGTRVSLNGVRVGVPRAFFCEGLDRSVSSAFEAALTRVGRAGAAVRDVTVPVDATTMTRVFDPIVVAEIHQTYATDWRERPQVFSRAFAGFFEAPVPTGLELAAAHVERRRFQVETSRVFETVDVLVMPTVPIVAPLIEGPIDGGLILRNTWPFNAAHAPALSLPCGPADGLPVGLQLVARPFDDARLLHISASLERALRGPA
jgi:aspartyl-tRNA(Asn)/glutamyl-tRNA(Gln) amidotransferase subunit A